MEKIDDVSRVAKVTALEDDRISKRIYDYLYWEKIPWWASHSHFSIVYVFYPNKLNRVY